MIVGQHSGERAEKKLEESLEIGGPAFTRWYQEWKAGRVQDQAILNVYGEEWLFFFQVNRDGIEGDTLEDARGQPPERVETGEVWPEGRLLQAGSGVATIVDVDDTGDSGQGGADGKEGSQQVDEGDEYQKERV